MKHTNKNKVKRHGRMMFVYGEYWNPWPIRNNSFVERIQGLDFESYDIDYLIHKIVETTRISIPKTPAAKDVP